MKAKKNIILATVLAVLLGISISLGFWEEGGGSAFDPGLFALEDINQVDRVVMTRGEEVLDFRAFSQGFLINDQYPMDQGLLSVLGAVLQQVRVQRPVSEKLQAGIWEDLQQQGTRVQVYMGEKLLEEFWAGGDALKQTSYFATGQGAVYVVNLPGYTSYVSGLFSMELSGWRTKNVFRNTWRSILSFKLEDNRAAENNLEITYKDPFFGVSGVQKIDSNRVINYLENLGALRAEALIDTSYQGDPWKTLTTEDIDPLKNTSLILFEPGKDSLILGRSQDQYYLFRKQRINPLLQTPGYFERPD